MSIGGPVDAEVMIVPPFSVGGVHPARRNPEASATVVGLIVAVVAPDRSILVTFIAMSLEPVRLELVWRECIAGPVGEVIRRYRGTLIQRARR